MSDEYGKFESMKELKEFSVTLAKIIEKQQNEIFSLKEKVKVLEALLELDVANILAEKVNNVVEFEKIIQPLRKESEEKDGGSN